MLKHRARLSWKIGLSTYNLKIIRLGTISIKIICRWHTILFYFVIIWNQLLLYVKKLWLVKLSKIHNYQRLVQFKIYLLLSLQFQLPNNTDSLALIHSDCLYKDLLAVESLYEYLQGIYFVLSTKHSWTVMML